MAGAVDSDFECSSSSTILEGSDILSQSFLLSAVQTGPSAPALPTWTFFERQATQMDPYKVAVLRAILPALAFAADRD